MKNLGRYSEDLSIPRRKDVEEKYTMPTGGIPKSDLSSSVQSSLDKAENALQTAPVTSVNGKTGAVTVREVPSVTASDNGKFLRVVSGAWAAVEIANANGGSF
jgi:hypothetical protein